MASRRALNSDQAAAAGSSTANSSSTIVAPARSARALYRVHRVLQHVQPSPFAACRAARTVTCAASASPSSVPASSSKQQEESDFPSTADLCDAHPSGVQLLPAQWRHFGSLRSCHGPALPLRTFEDNGLVRATLEKPGQGRVLLVEGGASMRCALVGDQLAALAVKNGWGGLVVYGAVRDVAALSRTPVCIAALGSSPVRSVRVGWGIVGQPVVVGQSGGGVRVCEGDWIYVDDDGVLVAKEPLHQKMKNK